MRGAPSRHWARRARGGLVVAGSLALHAAVWLAAPKTVPPPRVVERPETVSIELFEAPAPAPAEPPAPPEPPALVEEPSAPEPVVQAAPEPVSIPEPEAIPPVVEQAPPEKVAEVAPPAAPEGAAEPAESGEQPSETPPVGSSPAGAEVVEAPVRPENVQLFSGAALGQTVGSWKGSLDAQAEATAARHRVDPNDPVAEATRVTTRVAATLVNADIQARVKGGFHSTCDDGADNDLDGVMDCADPACRKRPECANTGIYEDAPWMDIPDDDIVGLSSVIKVNQQGPVRKLAVQLHIRHGSPGDVTVMLEHVDTGEVAVLRHADRRDATLAPAFYVREFKGKPAKGRWRLRVRDEVAGARGRLEKWVLVISS